MAEFIQQAAAQEAQTQGSPTDFLSPQQQNQMADQAAASVAPEQQPPAGMPSGAGLGATQENPVTAPEEEASPEEQKQYDDLFMRAMALINDTRAKGQEPSPADALIALMSEKGKAAHESIGKAAGMVMQILIDMSKRNGVEYSGPALQEVALDCCEELAEIAKLSGAISNMPEQDSPEWAKLMELTALEAAKHIGEWMLQTGQADRQGHMQEIQQQMKREADAGELEDWGMEELDPQIRQRVAGAIQDGQTGGR
jgi:hypothetical protein